MQIRKKQSQYQDKKVEAFLTSNKKKIILQELTGIGKTTIAIKIIKKFLEQNKKVVFFTHTIELRDQSFKRIKEAGIDCGILASGFDFDDSKNCYIAMIQTAYSREKNYAEIGLKSFKNIDLVIFDEAHRIDSPQWQIIQDFFSQNFSNARHLGLSATPIGSNGKGLEKYFDEIIHGMQMCEAIQDGFLCDCDLYVKKLIDYSSLEVDTKSSEKSDFTKTDLAKISKEIEKKEIYGKAVDLYKKFAENKQTLIFCISIEHCAEIKKKFNDAGIKADVIHSCLDTKTREKNLELFKNNQIQVLINVAVFIEGVDIPNIQCIIDISPTKSLRRHLQKIGRGFRVKDDNSNLILIDCVDNCERHGGHPSLAVRYYSLNDYVKRGRTKSSGDEVNFAFCENCNFCYSKKHSKCPKCDCVNKSYSNEEDDVDFILKEKKHQEEYRLRQVAEKQEEEKIQNFLIQLKTNTKDKSSQHSMTKFENARNVMCDYIGDYLTSLYKNQFLYIKLTYTHDIYLSHILQNLIDSNENNYENILKKIDKKFLEKLFFDFLDCKNKKLYHSSCSFNFKFINNEKQP